MRTQPFLTFLIFMCFSSIQAIAQDESVTYTKRGLVREVLSQPDPHLVDSYRTMVILKGTSDRAACPAIKLSEFDKAGLEMIKLSIELNRPLEISFTVARGKPDQQEQNPDHCQAVSIGLKP